MTKDKKVFCLNDYIRSFEKSLHYMMAALLAIFVVGMSWRLAGKTELFSEVKIIWDDLQKQPRQILCIITAVLSTLPYYYYYTLKDNPNWNACRGRNDIQGLIKIYILYEIVTVSLFYLLIQNEADCEATKLILSAAGAVLTLIYIGILIYRRNKEVIGYFILVIFVAFMFFTALFSNNLLSMQPQTDPLINALFNQKANIQVSSSSYDLIIFMLLFPINAAINLFILHRFDSCKGTGIIVNRIKIFIPIISIAVYTTSIMYCFYYYERNLIMMLTVAVWITCYEVIISFIKCYNALLKTILCIFSFLAFVMGLPLLIWYVEENFTSDLIANWFFIIGVCIYLVSIKYFGYIVILLFQTRGNAKMKLVDTVIWFRNSVLGSILFILVILISIKKHFLLLVTIIPCAFMLEAYVYIYVFSDKRKNNINRAFIIGKVIECIAVCIPLLSYILESVLNINWIERLPDDKNVIAVVGVAVVITILAIVFLYTLSKYDSNEWGKLPTLEKKEILRKLWNNLRATAELADNLSEYKNAENFWTAFLTWGIYIIVSLISLWYQIPISDQALASPYRIGITFIWFLILGVDWFFLTKNVFNYNVRAMRESEEIMKYKMIIKQAWNQCLDELIDFNESDAKQFSLGSYYRAIVFFLGAIYGQKNEVSQEVIQAAAKAACSMELIHKSAILLDDYMDGDEIRNGEESFHNEYPDQKVLHILRNSLQAKALMNFMQCRESFLCNNDIKLKNMETLSQIIYNTNLGRYRELSLADYKDLRSEEVNTINDLETVSFFRESMRLGYSCFHANEGNRECQMIGQLGAAFGAFYQYINDMEPFSQKARHIYYKGELKNWGKKNIAVLTLYQHLSEIERKDFANYDYHTIEKLYRQYCIEQELLDEINIIVTEIEKLLSCLKCGNRRWVNNFEIFFNQVLDERRWNDKIPKLGNRGLFF